MDRSTETGTYSDTNEGRTSTSECGIVHKNGETSNASPNEDALPKWTNQTLSIHMALPSGLLG